MATISYQASAKSGSSTAYCLITVTYSVSNSNTATTVTASKLVTSKISAGGGTSDQNQVAENNLRSNLLSMPLTLLFDEQTVATRTGVYPDTTYTSYIGSKSVTKTHSSQSKTLKFHGSTTTSITVPAKPSYTISYNANSGSGAPASQTKWYGESLTLSTSKPTKSGYTFKGWATSTSNASSGTVNYASGASYTGNSAATLYAVWELTYSKPKLTGLTINRCLSDGTLDDEGTYAKVTFNWSIFKSSATRYYNGSGAPYSNNAPTCSINIGGIPVTPSLTSTPFTTVVGDGSYSVDQEYTATVTLSDTQTVYTGSAKTTTVNSKLSTAIFPIDINADGTAMGLFRAAPDNGNGVYFGKDIYPKGATSPIGSVKYAYLASETSVANNTYRALCNISLDSGTWIINAGVRWNTNANGAREMNIYTSSGSSEMQLTVPPISGNWTQTNLTKIVKVASDSVTYYLNARQTSGGALGARAGGENWGTYITAVRIA